MDVYHEKDELRLEQGGSGNLVLLFFAPFPIVLAFLLAFGVVQEESEATRWFVSLLSMALGLFMLLYAIIMSGYELHIGADGIREVYRRGFKRERRLAWDEIADWGYAYYGRAKYGKLYVLYFSSVPLTDRKKGKKKLTKTTIYTEMFDSELELKAEKDILPFCSRFTDIPPNIPEK